MSGARLAFGAALAATLLVGHLLRDTPGYMVHNPDGTTTGDITHYVYWTRLVTLRGIQSAYAGTWPETYAVYPPINLYAYQAVGTIYRAVEDPEFDARRAQTSLFLHEGIKFVALGWHVLTGIAIFWLLGRQGRPALAAAAGAAYLLDPAALFDVAHWAQPDGAHALFSVLAVGLLSAGRVVLPWAFLALAALAKPQAWSILPLLTIATLRRPPSRLRGEEAGFADAFSRLARGVIVAAIVALIVVAPFLVTGHRRDLLSLPGTIASIMPVVSADAHNLWWLVVEPRGEDPLTIQDSVRVIGPLTYRMVAATLVGAVVLLTSWLYWSRRASLAESAALGVLGWFAFTTQVHENHLFFALPLLALAWPSRPGLLVPYVVISITLFLNMFLHDQLLLEGLGRGLQDPLIEQLRLANAAANVACCLGWSLVAAVRPPDRTAAWATMRYWPRHMRAKAPT